MAHNTRTRADITAWSSATAAVLPSELDKLDGYAFASINGDAGGVWAPASAITIGGDGMVITGLLWLQGTGLLSSAPAQFQNTVLILNTLTVTGGLVTANAGVHVTGAPLTVDAPAVFNDVADFFGNVTTHTGAFFQVGGSAQLGNDATKTLDIEATLTANGPATFNGTVNFFDDITLHTSAFLQVGGDSQIGNDSSKALDVEATATFNAPVTMNGTLDCWTPVLFHTAAAFTCNASATFNGAMALGDTSGDSIDVPGTMNLHTAMAFSFSGRVPFRPTLGPNANQTFSAKETNFIFVRADALNADRTYLIDTGGTSDGDFVWVSASFASNARTLFISELGGANFCSIRGNGELRCLVLLMRIAGTWQCAFSGTSNANVEP